MRSSHFHDIFKTYKELSGKDVEVVLKTDGTMKLAIVDEVLHFFPAVAMGSLFIVGICVRKRHVCYCRKS